MSSLKRILLVPGFLLALASFLPAQSSDWVKVAPAGGDFIVMMPAEPKELELTPGANFTARAHGVLIDDVIYICLYGDYAASIHLNPDAELAANRDNFLKTLNASLISTKKIELDGRAGLEFTGENAQTTFQSRSIFMVTGSIKSPSACRKEPVIRQMHLAFLSRSHLPTPKSTKNRECFIVAPSCANHFSQ